MKKKRSKVEYWKSKKFFDARLVLSKYICFLTVITKKFNPSWRMALFMDSAAGHKRMKSATALSQAKPAGHCEQYCDVY